MKWVKRILLTLLTLIALLAIVGFFLPSTYHVERSITIKGKPADVFAYVNTLKRWQEWSPWNVERYPDMKQEYSGPESGVGSTMSWTGSKSGTGSFKIARSTPDKDIGYDLDFERGQYLSNGEIRLEPAGENVKVTWTNDGSLGKNPFARYFGLLMDKFMGPDFEKGLSNLKTKVEAPK